MKKQQDLLRELPIYFSIYCIFLFVGMTLLAYFGKDNLHLYFNQFHTNFSDIFFKLYTDWVINIALVVLIVYIFWKKTWNEMTLLLIPYTLGSLINTLIKRGFFEHIHRPTYYFETKNIKLHLVEGVRSQIPYTFPSGHSLNAFLFFAILCLLFKNKWLQIVFAFMAILVAISRIYLSKHFVLDTLGGSFLGMMLFVFTYYLLQNAKYPFLYKKCNFIQKK